MCVLEGSLVHGDGTHAESCRSGQFPGEQAGNTEEVGDAEVQLAKPPGAAEALRSL